MKVPAIFKQKETRKVESFITRAELAEIQTDISRVVVPSWFTKLQPTFGEIHNGKLKAAEWHSLFSTYLPITLTRIWGRRLDRRLQLKGVLLLAMLVNVACSTTVSPISMEFAGAAARLYLQFISTLGDEALRVNHHLALHLPFFMELHGPSRTHWAFPYERLIGKIQRLLRNPQIGEVLPAILYAY